MSSPSNMKAPSITETYRLASTARRKLRQEAAKQHASPRLLVGHANLVDTLKQYLSQEEDKVLQRVADLGISRRWSVGWVNGCLIKTLWYKPPAQVCAQPFLRRALLRKFPSQERSNRLRNLLEDIAYGRVFSIRILLFIFEVNLWYQVNFQSVQLNPKSSEEPRPHQNPWSSTTI